MGRQLAVAEELLRLGGAPTIITAAPSQVVHEVLPGVEVIPLAVDVGLAQPDSLREDLPRTLALLEARCADLEPLSRVLGGFDLVVADTAPSVLEAARLAGVPAVAVGNFDWAWIYGHYPELAAWAARFAEWQAPHRGLSLWPGPGLRGFAHVEAFGPVGRRRAPVRVAERAALVSFGGFGLDLELPEIDGLTWILAPPMAPRPGARFVEGVPYPSLVAGADLVLTKPGYGILVEAMLSGVRLLYVPRPGFPEAASLEAVMEERGDVRLSSLRPEAIREGVEAALARPRPAPVQGDTARLAERLMALAAAPGAPASPGAGS